MSEPLSFSGAIATDVLVGRRDELDRIRHAVNPSERSAFRCVLLKGEGGKGKTRLLREVCLQLGVSDELSTGASRRSRDWNLEQVIALPLIDVADPRLHGVVPFLREIRRGFRSYAWISAETMFAEFDKAMADYEDARETGMFAADTDLLQDAFTKAYASVTSAHRVVWVLDTMEQLFPPPPEIDYLFNELNITAASLDLTTYDWLLKLIAEHPPNTTMILAGRPEPGTWANELKLAAQPKPQQDRRLPALRASLEREVVAQAEDGVVVLPVGPSLDSLSATGDTVITLDLRDFDPLETRTYLRELSQQLSSELAHQPVAEYLHDFLDDTEQPEVLYWLTGGNPVRLALYIDLLVSVDIYPEEFRYKLETLRAMEPKQLELLRSGIDNALLTYLAQRLDEPDGQVLEYLAITRRGLDVERLAYIWSGDHGEAKAAFGRLRRLSFVKYRPDGRYFLHDEFYTIYQRGFTLENEAQQTANREYRGQIFKKLIDLCEEQYSQCSEQIYEMTTKLHEVNLKRQKTVNEKSDDLQNEHAFLKRDIAMNRQKRQQLIAEQAHYSLYRDPLSGFKDTYFELVEQALSAYDLELAAQLQSEVDLFFFGIASDLNRRQTGFEQFDWDLLRFAVVYDRVTSWIRRLSRLGKYEHVKDFTDAALQTCDQLIHDLYGWASAIRATPDGEFLRTQARLEWKAFQLNAAILQGKTLSESIVQIEQIAENFADIMSGNYQGFGALQLDIHKIRKRLLNARAHCLISAGYGYTTLFLFDQAESRYSEADRLLVETGLEVLLARVKNDLSRVLGELGHMDRALRLCDEGMRIRRALGFDAMRALSFNTMALIYNRSARQREALYHAQEALSLFRQLANERGVGLALLQIAEAQRRICNFEVSEARRYGSAYKRDYSATFSAAKAELQEAETIFSGTFKEEARLLEVKIELGCLERDWAAILDQKAGGDHFTNAETYFYHAIDIAVENNYEQQLLAARVSRAWLYKKCDLNEEAQQLAREALISVPARYHLESPEFLDDSSSSNSMIFRHLSKIYSLLAGIPPETPQHFYPILESHMLAIAYQQLFSQYESWFLRVNKRAFYSTLSKFKLRFPEMRSQIWQTANQVIETNHLAKLGPDFDLNSIIDIINDVFPQRTDSS
jgi:hypothetical protein